MLFHRGANVQLIKISSPDWNIYRTLGLLYVFFLIPLIFNSCLSMPGCYICPKPGPDLNCMLMSPRSTSPLHTCSMFQGFVRQKSTNHTCLNKHFLHTTKSELLSACTSSLLRELTQPRKSRGQ